jgi:hypothetical protein
MLSNRRLRLQRSCAVIPLFLVALSSPAAGQSAAANPEVEDIVNLRSLRLSRIEPTGFCAPTDPPGYTQPSIATVRLGKKRSAQ